jgi:pilus assembly protein CpaB
VKTRMLTIVLAAVLGLVGVVAVLAYVHQANQRAVNGLKAVTVLFAKSPIPAGTSLYKAQQDSQLGTEKVPESSLSATPEPVTAAKSHMVLIAKAGQGSILLENMLASASEIRSETGGGITPPRDMVDVSVHMCVSEAVANYVTAGSYVAVFDTLVAHPSGIVRTCEAQHDILGSADIRQSLLASTLLVLAKAKVVAVGVNPAAPNSSGSSSVTVTNDPSSGSSTTDEEVLVTLEVDQADAERVALIGEVGLPYMALLSGADSTATAPAGPVNLFQLQQP